MALPVSRAGRAAFWLGTPLVVAGSLFWPHRSAWLPGPLADVSFDYPATLVALAILMFVLVQRRRTPAARPSLSLAAFDLPTCVAGIESVRLIGWSLRCHGFTDSRQPAEIVASGASLSGAVLLATVAAGALAARACGQRSRLGVTAVAVAVVAQIMMQWGFLWLFVNAG